jgi:hypothetical protein
LKELNRELKEEIHQGTSMQNVGAIMFNNELFLQDPHPFINEAVKMGYHGYLSGLLCVFRPW